jgi:asparagine N-glycosylation enzyme membrane subunit Stt3
MMLAFGGLGVMLVVLGLALLCARYRVPPEIVLLVSWGTIGLTFGALGIVMSIAFGTAHNPRVRAGGVHGLLPLALPVAVAGFAALVAGLRPPVPPSHYWTAEASEESR